MNMYGKTVLITGATAGIGFFTAAQIARKGARVFVTGRDQRRGELAAAELRLRAGQQDIHFLAADASSVADNVALAHELGRRINQLDVLINNAGGVVNQRKTSREGHEMTLALNFIGPIALTQQLLHRLGRSDSARVINVVSSAFQMWKRDPLEDLEARDRYVGIETYAHAKLLNLLFTLALARDLQGTKISVNAINPGTAWTPGTESLTREAVPMWRFVWPLVRAIQRRAPATKAAEAVSSLAMSAGIGSGQHYEGKKKKSLPPHLIDRAIQQRVWELGGSLVEEANAMSSARVVSGSERMGYL